MGQNQARVGEQQATLEEKEPSPDPGGSVKEGNASEVTCREVEDEVGLVRERLDVSPGTEPASPTPKLDTHSHKKRAPPIDWEWIQGGDGEREGGRERGEGEGGRTEVRGLQELSNIRVTIRGTSNTEVAGSSKAEHAAVAAKSNRMDLENSANDSHEWKVMHKDNIQDLAWDSSSRVENVHFQQSRSSATEEKTVTSEVTGSLNKQDESVMTGIVAVPDINALTVTADFHDDNFPFEMPILNTEAPTRTAETNNLESMRALFQKNLLGENPLWKHGPAAFLMSSEPSLDEEDREKFTLSNTSTDNPPLKWSSAKSDCQEKITSRELGRSEEEECTATSGQIYATEIPSLPSTIGLSGRLEDKTTENIRLLNSGDICGFGTTARENLGKKHQAAGSNIESVYTTEKNMTNPDSSVMSFLGLASYKDPTTSGFEEVREEEKHLYVSDSERAKNYAERNTDISCDAGGVSHDTKETEEFPLKQDDRADCYLPAETVAVQNEKIPQQFLAVVTRHSEMLSLPDMTKGITGEKDPHLAAMESKYDLARRKELRSQNISVEGIASETSLDKLSGNIMFSNQDWDKGNTLATGETLEEQSTAMLDKDKDGSSGETVSSKRNRDNQSVQKNLTSVADIHLVSESTAGHEEGRSLPSPVESKTCMQLTEISESKESHELENMTNEAKLCTEDTMKDDGCGGPLSQNPGTDNATTPLNQIQNSPQGFCMQHNTSHNNLTPQSTGQSLASDRGAIMVSQNIGIRNDQSAVSAQGGTTAGEKAESAPKGKPVSDLIKETIQLHEKMKEWTKPAEAKADVVLDSSQSIKVAQMKAAFDSPKKSLDKGLEKKPSVRKGKSFEVHAS